MKKYSLPKEFAEKWVEALRNKRYKQVKFSYKRDGCYCAVGLGYHANGYKILENSNDLIGASDFIYVDNFKLWDEVTSLSDKDTPFPEIADWITENVNFI